MVCADFRNRLEEEGIEALEQLPNDLADHHVACSKCQSFVQEEALWQRLFAAVPSVSPTKSLWPGVLYEIQDQLERRESFSATFVLFGRRLAPVFALFLILAVGATFWRAPGVEAQDALPMIAMLENGSGRLGPLTEEPEAILSSWAGANKR